LQQLCPTKLYFGIFWHKYISVNFLSKAYFTFFIKSKAENQLKFKQCSASAQRVSAACMCAQPLSCFVAWCQTSSQHPICGYLTYLTLVLLIIESWNAATVDMSTSCATCW